MNDSEHESLRSYLAGEDEREKANRAAEQAKQFIKRKCAMKYGDQGSPVEPINLLTFCTACGDSISDDNRSTIHGKCTPCFVSHSIEMARKSNEIARESYAKAAKESAAASFWPAAIATTIWIAALTACAILLGIAVGWGADKLCYWIGWSL